MSGTESQAERSPLLSHPPGGPRRRRSGSILVVVATGLMVILLFASMAVDVGFWFLTRTRLNGMTQAAANAGYEMLKQHGFRYSTYQSDVDAAIRAYLEFNGATSAEAAAAEISVSRRGEIRVGVTRDTPSFFANLGGISSQAVAGTGELLENNIGPYGIPTSYQDPDQDGMPNWDRDDETILTDDTPWDFEVGSPYIVKFGQGDRTGLDAHLLLIPMDDEAHQVDWDADGNSDFFLPAQDMAGSFKWYGDQPKATRDGEAGSDIGILRAYGVAYDILGLPRTDTNGDGVIDEQDEKAPVQWLLGYDGGALTIAEEAMARAGYTFVPQGVTNNAHWGLLRHDTKGLTPVVAIQLKVDVINDAANTRAADIDFVEHLSDLMDEGKIKGLAIDYQPQIATFTEYEDPVTSTMINAGIPFTAFTLEEGRSVYHSFGINPATESSDEILAKLDDPANHGPFDWLHLHHENFIQRLSGVYVKEYQYDELCEGQRYDTYKSYHVVESRLDMDHDGIPEGGDLNQDGDVDDIFFFEDHTNTSEYEISPPVNLNDVWYNEIKGATQEPAPHVAIWCDGGGSPGSWDGTRCNFNASNSDDGGVKDPWSTQRYGDGWVRWKLLDIDGDGVVTDGKCFGNAVVSQDGNHVRPACEGGTYGTNRNFHLHESRLDLDQDGVPGEPLDDDFDGDGDANDIYFIEAHDAEGSRNDLPYYFNGSLSGYNARGLYANYRTDFRGNIGFQMDADDPLPFVSDRGGSTTRWQALDFNRDGHVGTDTDGDGLPDLDADGDGTPDEALCFGEAMRHATYSGQHYVDKESLVHAIWRHVSERDGFVFAACWATDTLDSALARLSSPDFVFSDSSTYNSSKYLFTGADLPQGNDSTRKSQNKPESEGGVLRYDMTFAFQNFHLRSGSTYMGTQSSLNDISEIEYNESSTQHYLVDYLNPLLQNHMGFLGIDLQEETGLMGVPNSNDYLIKQGGATDAFRHQGASWSGHNRPDIIKPHVWPTGGLTDPRDTSSGGIQGGRVLMLAQKRSSSTRPMESDKSLPMVYLSGISFDEEPDGIDHHFGRWSYLGGHGQARGRNKPSFGSGWKYRFACEGEQYNKNEYFVESTAFVDINRDGDQKDIVRLSSLSLPHLYVEYGSNSNYRELKDLNGDGDRDDCFNMSIRYTVQSNYLEGSRIYLNNILYGATVRGQGGGIPNSGAINPANLDLGSGPGDYGNLDFAKNNFATMFKVGAKKLGLPIGAQFDTAPGDFSEQVKDASNFLFEDEQGTRESITWKQFTELAPEEQAGHPQVTTIAVIERIPDPPGALQPTPRENLSDFMDANAARELSIYAGTMGVPHDHPSQARPVHLIGFAEFFLVDPSNQDPVTQDGTGEPDHFVASKWRDGEVRGYFLGWIIPPEAAQFYPQTRIDDPRDAAADPPYAP